MNAEVTAEEAPPTASTPVGKVLMKSYGCQMNVYDTTRMSELLENEGYIGAQDENDADLVLLNTCHIREKAADKIYSELGKLAILKNNRNAEGRDLKIEDKFSSLAHPTKDQIRQRGISAFVTVQEGCDKFCSFCVVPYTRGAEVSRSVDEIIAETQRLVDAGVSEITLIGQNVNAYRGLCAKGKEWSLARLIEKIADISGVARIRYTTSHPVDMSQDLIEAHGSIEKLMPYVHLPVQAGSDAILKAMNRKHTAQTYLDIISRLRAVRADIALSSDFIVGFPGESDADFEATLTLIRAVNFASSYSFKYSPRPGTPGAERDNQISDEIKSARLHILQSLLEEQRQAFNTATIDRVVDVLFEKPGRHDGQIGGKTPYLQAVFVDGPVHLIGKIAPVSIRQTGPNSLTGALVYPHNEDMS